jgi:hypothetical protein
MFMSTTSGLRLLSNAAFVGVDATGQAGETLDPAAQFDLSAHTERCRDRIERATGLLACVGS